MSTSQLLVASALGGLSRPGPAPAPPQPPGREGAKLLPRWEAPSPSLAPTALETEATCPLTSVDASFPIKEIQQGQEVGGALMPWKHFTWVLGRLG